MTVSAEPWLGEQVALCLVNAATLEALQRADLDAAQACSPHLRLTDFVVSDHCIGTWRRRYRQVQAQPRDTDWVTRLVVLRANNAVVGRAGFHGAPDADGVVEIGYNIDPRQHRRGYGTMAIRIMVGVARRDPAVTAVRASVVVANAVSRAMLLREGFVKVGEKVDEQRGPADVFMLSFETPRTLVETGVDEGRG